MAPDGRDVEPFRGRSAENRRAKPSAGRLFRWPGDSQ
jgi:hypothetical protein